MPIHNAGEHLYKCLDSLVNQSLKEIEIILVLDCPTDGSDVVAKEYAKMDSRIKIIENCENLHIGLSRNRGIDVAVGEYIGFSDHDDYREINMYEDLYAVAKINKSDVVISSFGSDTRGVIKSIVYPDIHDYEVKDFVLDRLIGRDENTPKNEIFFCQNGAMWNKIYKAEFLKNNDICFVDTKKYTYEDLIFLIKSFMYAKKVDLVNKVYYYHRQDVQNTSAMYTYNEYKKILAYLEIVNDFLHLNDFEKYKNRFYHSVVNSVHISIENEFKSKKSLIEKIKIFQFFRKDYIKEAFKLVVKLKVNDDAPIYKIVAKKIIATYYSI